MMNRPEQVPTHSKQILNDTVNVQEPLGVGRCPLNRIMANAPVSGNPHSPLSTTVTLQRMQVVAGQVHVCRLHRGVQVREDAPNPRSKSCGDAAGVSPLEGCQQPLVCDVDMETVT